MLNLKEILQDAQTVAILGHVRPDGDCIGSCLALYNYIETYFPNVKATVYLQEFQTEFLMLKNADKIVHDWSEDVVYDVCFSLDSADKERHGEAVKYFDNAKHTVGIDHHASNVGFAQEHWIVSDAAATAEMMYDLIGKEHLTKEIAECLYVGIAHDTGIFQYSNASGKIYRAVADLLEAGVEASKIIDRTFYEKSYQQNRMLGKALNDSKLYLEGKVVATVVTMEDMEAYGVTAKELDGIVSQLRYTKGVLAAIFLYELEPGQFKASMRSNDVVNVSSIASAFGGGGHVKAAGCGMAGTSEEIIGKILEKIEEQL
jgi:phosphoesterase RecJ-like protein